MRKRTIEPLPELQKQTLIEMYRHHPKTRMRERAHMVLLSSQGRDMKEICSIVYRSENTVATWLNAYEDKGFLGLYDEPIPGRPPTLNQDQQEQIGTWLDDSPRKEGYQQSNWTLKLVNHHVLQEFGQHFSLSRIWEIVRGQGFTLIRPRHKTIVPTQKDIVETNSKTFYYLEKARLGEVRLFYLDETPATMWSTLSYMWARKGTRPAIPMADDHGRMYVFSAADPLNGKVHYRIAPSNHKEDVVYFLRQMRSRSPVDKLVFRLDNHKSHKAHIVNQFAADDGNMKLEHLNRYTSLYGDFA